MEASGGLIYCEKDTGPVRFRDCKRIVVLSEMGF